MASFKVSGSRARIPLAEREFSSLRLTRAFSTCFQFVFCVSRAPQMISNCWFLVCGYV
jgi:hypothetical protein